MKKNSASRLALADSAGMGDRAVAAENFGFRGDVWESHVSRGWDDGAEMG